MPTVFRRNGYRFFFYSNDHMPIHIHVEKGDGEAKFNVIPAVELVESKGLKTKELNEAELMIKKELQSIINTWTDHFGGS